MESVKSKIDVSFEDNINYVFLLTKYSKAFVYAFFSKQGFPDINQYGSIWILRTNKNSNTKYSFQHFITTHYVYFPVFFVICFLSLFRANTFLAFNLKHEALPISRKYNTDKIHIKSFELLKFLDGKWMLNCLHLAQEEKVPFLDSKSLHLCKWKQITWVI